MAIISAVRALLDLSPLPYSDDSVRSKRNESETIYAHYGSTGSLTSMNSGTRIAPRLGSSEHYDPNAWRW